MDIGRGPLLASMGTEFKAKPSSRSKYPLKLGGRMTKLGRIQPHADEMMQPGLGSLESGKEIGRAHV